MTNERLKVIFPKASKSFLDANPDCLSSSGERESSVLNRPHGTPERKAGYAGRCAVRVTSYRKRLSDPDNLCAKYFVDALRYAGVLYDDRQIDIDFSIRQNKVKEESQEKTLIEIIPLDI